MSKKSVGIFLFDNVEVLDFAGPFEVFSVSSELHDYTLYDVFTFAKKTPVIAVNDLSVNPKYSFSNIPNIDILILPGGVGTRSIIKDTKMLQVLRTLIEKSMICITVCSGSLILGQLGYLENQVFCTHHEIYPVILKISPKAKPQRQKRFVAFDKFFTSGGISAGIDVSFHVLEKLYGKNVVKKTATYMEYPLKK